MFKPSLKSIWSLAALTLISIVVYYIAQNSYSFINVEGYDEKIAAAKHAEKCMTVLGEEAKKLGFVIDSTNDPNKTGLIGLSGSPVTTSRGILGDKLLGLNPNFAAVFVDMFMSARLNEGDFVAIGLTGSNPGINIALYSAMHTLKLKPVVITSVGSSMFGANREDFSWLDMERILYDNGLIEFKSVAASIGGGADIGRGLSRDGREAITQNIISNGVEFINEPSLVANVDKRMDIYSNHLNDKPRYRMFVNLGGALANVGSSVNASLILDGINRRLAERNFAIEGAIMKFSRKNIPVLHVFRPSRIADRYGLEKEPISEPEIGLGEVYITKVNNVTVASICLAILILSLIVVIVFDRHDRHFTTNIIDPDQELL